MPKITGSDQYKFTFAATDMEILIFMLVKVILKSRYDIN